MNFIKNLKPKKLLKNWVFWLIIITGLAIIIRSIPAWIHAAWGCDFGIYFGITKTIAETKVLFPSYTGWGSSYNEFPVLYLINVFAHWVTGLDIIIIMPKLAPIFGGLSVFIFYFVARELTDTKKIALVASLFFAFLPFHVYQTSHASPLTFGHFFTMLSLFFFIKYRKKNKYFIPLIISTILLIMSHHLTTYFYLITIIGIIFVENVSQKNWTLTLRKDIFITVLTSLMIFSYWAFVAKTIYERSMAMFKIGSIHIEPIFIVISFYILFAFLFKIIKLLRRFNEFLIKKHEKPSQNNIKRVIINIIWTFYPFVKKEWPKSKNRIAKFFLIFVILFGLMTFFSIVDMPWLGFTLTFESILYALPLLIAIVFGIIGFRYTGYDNKGFFIRGWILALTISFVIMLATNNTTFFPHRHPEYIMAPLSITIVYGIGSIFSDPHHKKTMSELENRKDLKFKYKTNKFKISQKSRLISTLIVLLLITSLSATTYEVHKMLDQSREEITNQDYDSIKWIGNNLDKNKSLIVSDHRLERMAESVGFNTSQDEIIKLWTAENVSEYIDELIGVGKNYSRITHVIVDDIMKNQLVHIGPFRGKFRTLYMTNETWTAAYDKFTQQPFELVCKNTSIDINSETEEPIHWTEVYMINWTYIDRLFTASYFDKP